MFGLFGNKIPTLSMQDAQAELAKDRSIILLDVRTKKSTTMATSRAASMSRSTVCPSRSPRKCPINKPSFLSTA